MLKSPQRLLSPRNSKTHCAPYCTKNPILKPYYARQVDLNNNCRQMFPRPIQKWGTVSKRAALLSRQFSEFLPNLCHQFPSGSRVERLSYQALGQPPVDDARKSPKNLVYIVCQTEKRRQQK